jgi:Zn2+/Cd2+-exporting ATPase
VSARAACEVCELRTESTFTVEGMDCREEVERLNRRFTHLAGLEDFSADLVAKRLHVTYDASKLSTATIADAVADAGMRAWLEHEEPIAATDGAVRRRWLLLGAAALSCVAGALLEHNNAPSWTETLVFSIAIASAGASTARKAWAAVRTGVLDINVLMVAAVAGAIALGQWTEAAAVVCLFAVAQALEAQTVARARSALRSLMELTPTEALVRDHGGERRISVDLVQPGTVIVVRPGERIPLDGEVVAGESAVNQAPVTGESLPADKSAGDEVFAGTINGHGALEIRVTRVRRDTTLARIVHLVERAQAQRAPAQTFVERFARVYTPAVVGLAALLAVVPPLAFGGDWRTWTYRALVLLVVSCPCALVISTPISIVAALAGAARRGVLIKGGVHLERAGSVRCVAFDKTGTLTRGRPDVVQVVGLNGVPPSEVVSLAASVERRSSHPIAHAILRYATSADIVVPAAADVQLLAGRGAEGRVNDTRIVLGNHRLFEERQLCSPAVHAELDAFGASGHTAVLVARDNRTVGLIAVADRARASGRQTLELLRGLGVRTIVLLTGDGYASAKSVAEQLGMDEFSAELLPEDKVSAIADLRRRFGAVAMVGDGVNDAPALATADLGIAMGAAGSDAALETADVALMADELLKIPFAFRLGRAAVRNIRTNLAISLVMKAAFVVLAGAGVATLWMAVLADTGASVIVVANALTLLAAR